MYERLDDHERKITEILGFQLAIRGWTSGGSISDGKLFWAKKGHSRVAIMRKTRGLLRRRRTYCAYFTGEEDQSFPAVSDVAFAAQQVFEAISEKRGDK